MGRSHASSFEHRFLFLRMHSSMTRWCLGRHSLSFARQQKIPVARFSCTRERKLIPSAQLNFPSSRTEVQRPGGKLACTRSRTIPAAGFRSVTCLRLSRPSFNTAECSDERFRRWISHFPSPNLRLFSYAHTGFLFHVEEEEELRRAQFGLAVLISARRSDYQMSSVRSNVATDT